MHVLWPEVIVAVLGLLASRAESRLLSASGEVRMTRYFACVPVSHGRQGYSEATSNLSRSKAFFAQSQRFGDSCLAMH